MMIVSQDGLKAISAQKVDFLVVHSEKNSSGKFNLLAKTPTRDNNFYDYLIMFEHENIEVVKHVMRFLAGNQIVVPRDDTSNLLVVDLPDLYAHGMKKIAPELLTAEQAQMQESAIRRI